jgi:hypothetical protein
MKSILLWASLGIALAQQAPPGDIYVEEGAGGPCRQGGVHRRLQDPNRGCRGSIDRHRRRGIQSRPVAVPQRRQPNRAPDRVQEGLGNRSCAQVFAFPSIK